MKLGIAMLIMGLILAGVGVAAWSYADPNVSLWFGGSSVSEARIVDAVGLGITVIGGGLAIGGVVRMAVRR